VSSIVIDESASSTGVDESASPIGVDESISAIGASTNHFQYAMQYAIYRTHTVVEVRRCQ